MKATVNVAKESYENIKTVYANVLKRKIPKVTAKIQDGTFYDYVKNVYEELSRNESEERETAMHWLDVGRSEFDKMMCEVIALNLYCEIVVIEQLLIGRGMTREQYQIRKDMKKDDRAAFDKRLQFNRMRAIKRVEAGDDIRGSVYFIPIICKPFRDKLFVHRIGTNIWDISRKYLDIFEALFDYEKDNQKSAKDVASYMTWNMRLETIQYIEGIYCAIQKSKESDRIAQLVLMEKLFGLYAVRTILNQNNKVNLKKSCLHAISNIKELGYSRLHKCVINKLVAASSEPDSIIFSYIVSMCQKCIYICLKNAILYIGRNDDRCISVVGRFKGGCENLMKETINVFKENVYKLEDYDEKLVRDLIHRVNGPCDFPVDAYIASTRVLTHEFDDVLKEEYKTKLCFVYDYTTL